MQSRVDRTQAPAAKPRNSSIRDQYSWDPISCFFFSVLLVKPGFFQKIFLGVGLQRSHISGGNEVDWSPKPGISDKD